MTAARHRRAARPRAHCEAAARASPCRRAGGTWGSKRARCLVSSGGKRPLALRRKTKLPFYLHAWSRSSRCGRWMSKATCGATCGGGRACNLLAPSSPEIPASRVTNQFTATQKRSSFQHVCLSPQKNEWGRQGLLLLEGHRAAFVMWQRKPQTTGVKNTTTSSDYIKIKDFYPDSMDKPNRQEDLKEPASRLTERLL